MLKAAVFATCDRRLELALSLGVDEQYTGISPFDLGIRKDRRDLGFT